MSNYPDGMNMAEFDYWHGTDQPAEAKCPKCGDVAEQRGYYGRGRVTILGECEECGHEWEEQERG